MHLLNTMSNGIPYEYKHLTLKLMYDDKSNATEALLDMTHTFEKSYIDDAPNHQVAVKYINMRGLFLPQREFNENELWIALGHDKPAIEIHATALTYADIDVPKDVYTNDSKTPEFIWGIGQFLAMFNTAYKACAVAYNAANGITSATQYRLTGMMEQDILYFNRSSNKFEFRYIPGQYTYGALLPQKTFQVFFMMSKRLYEILGYTFTVLSSVKNFTNTGLATSVVPNDSWYIIDMYPENIPVNPSPDSSVDDLLARRHKQGFNVYTDTIPVDQYDTADGLGPNLADTQFTVWVSYPQFMSNAAQFNDIAEVSVIVTQTPIESEDIIVSELSKTQTSSSAATSSTSSRVSEDNILLSLVPQTQDWKDFRNPLIYNPDTPTFHSLAESKNFLNIRFQLQFVTGAGSTFPIRIPQSTSCYIKLIFRRFIHPIHDITADKTVAAALGTSNLEQVQSHPFYKQHQTFGTGANSRMNLQSLNTNHVTISPSSSSSYSSRPSKKRKY